MAKNKTLLHIEESVLGDKKGAIIEVSGKPDDVINMIAQLLEHSLEFRALINAATEVKNFRVVHGHKEDKKKDEKLPN